MASEADMKVGTKKRVLVLLSTGMIPVNMRSACRHRDLDDGILVLIALALRPSKQ